MLTITRTRTPEDYFQGYKFESPTVQSIPPTPIEFSTPKTQRESFAPRSFGSASSTDSDPFPDLLPWEALFEAQIWSNRFSTGQSVPSDVSRTEESIESPVESKMFDPSVILDPTSIEFGFQHSCLGGLDDKVLYSPRAAFAALCWEGATIISQDEGHDDSALCRDPFSMLDLDEEPSSPSSSCEHHIRVPISASLLWSDDSDSDSDECRTYHDDYTPVATIHDNATIMEAHPVGDFSPIEKEKGLFYRDLTASFIIVEPMFSTLPDPIESIGASPVPVINPNPPNKSVPKRIAAFCARFPSRLTSTVVR
ncbi:hypothetical protein EST38_g2712 [Candolleomyces aberdarensis]|uniref:Uncharacterized protein n=1 Tax=Candolleomyces aberdarensis TaxID=2316362 RepID=A0A4Q2DRU4_9AGAR|nr:hypothetical protein EST38_g2712 [Candolleomyces aberdarensis]